MTSDSVLQYSKGNAHGESLPPLALAACTIRKIRLRYISQYVGSRSAYTLNHNRVLLERSDAVIVLSSNVR